MESNIQFIHLNKGVHLIMNKQIILEELESLKTQASQWTDADDLKDDAYSQQKAFGATILACKAIDDIAKNLQDSLTVEERLLLSEYKGCFLDINEDILAIMSQNNPKQHMNRIQYKIDIYFGNDECFTSGDSSNLMLRVQNAIYCLCNRLINLVEQ